ncbi:MAG: pilus assembly protein PilM [Phycisphaeraceae bacterium]
MAFGFSKSRVSPIAIDFGADSLKLLQIVPGEPPQIVAAAAAEVPEHARTDPGARHAFYVDALKVMLAGNPFKGKRAVCSIPAYQTLVQHLQIAKIEQEDLNEQIGIMLRQRFNVDPSRMVIRSVMAGQVVRDGAAKQEVICMAASRDAVMRHIETAHRAKLDVVGMHCEPNAVIRSFAHLYRRSDDHERTTCFIDIGGATTKVLVTHGTDLVVAQNIHAAGDHLTRGLARNEKMGFTDARRQRIADASNVRPPTEASKSPVLQPHLKGIERRGLGGTPPGLAELDAQLAAELGGTFATATSESPASFARRKEENTDAVADVIECLIDELQLCIRYHQSVFSDRPIEKLVFLGGESRNVALCQKIAKTLRIGAQLGDPLARAMGASTGVKASGVDLRDPQPGWAVPLGLCLLES